MASPLELARPRDHVVAILAPAALVAVPTAVAAALNDQLLTTVVLAALVYLVLVIGTYIFIGNSGVVSFGQMAFMMVGAYVSALVSIPSSLKPVVLPDLAPWLQTMELPLLPSLLLGGVVAAICAVVVGYPLMRLSGIQAGIASLALLLIAQNVASHWDSVTLGTSTLVGIPADLSLGVALTIAIIFIVIAYGYQRSRFGLRLRAARENELAAVAAGVNVAKERLVAFVLSAFVCGVGGGMYAHYLGALNSSIATFFTPTFLTVAMLVIGGVFSLAGAVVGSVVISALVEVLRRLQEGLSFGDGATISGLDTAAVGVVLLVTLIFRPQGLTNGEEARWPRRRRRPTALEPDASKHEPEPEATTAMAQHP